MTEPNETKVPITPRRHGRYHQLEPNDPLLKGYPGISSPFEYEQERNEAE